MRITTEDLTEVEVTGSGVFDHLMRAARAHLDEEFTKNRIRGPEYSQVYLGTMQAVLAQSIQFLLERDRAAAQAALIQEQINTEQKQQALLVQQTENAASENKLIEANVLQVQAQTGLAEQQTLNLQAEALNITKQGNLLDAQSSLTEAQEAQTAQQTLNLEAEALNIPKQGLVLDGEKCKLDAEYDVLAESRLKTVAETSLLNQKMATEKAQTVGAGVDEDSYIGKQKKLYEAQAEGFVRDAEQKAAKLMADTWNVRRTTDEGVQANPTNRLDDTSVGRAINKLLTGIDA